MWISVSCLGAELVTAAVFLGVKVCLMKWRLFISAVVAPWKWPSRWKNKCADVAVHVIGHVMSCDHMASNRIIL